MPPSRGDVMQNGYVRARAGRVSPLVPVAVVGAAIAAGLWWFVGRGAGEDVRRTGEARAEERPAAELVGEQRPVALAPAAGGGEATVATAEPTSTRPAAGPWVWSKETVNQVLDTFWGKEPDIDRLLAMVRYLGEKAQIVPETVQFDPDTATTVGRIEIPELGLVGTFQIQRNRNEVHLETETKIPGVQERSFALGMRVGEIGLESGHAFIHHVVFEHDEALQHKLAVERHPAGWEVRTNLSRGTRAWPLRVPDPFAFEYDDKGPIPIPTNYTEPPVEEIVDRMRIDFGPWEVWRAKIDVYRR